MARQVLVSQGITTLERAFRVQCSRLHDVHSPPSPPFVRCTPLPWPAPASCQLSRESAGAIARQQKEGRGGSCSSAGHLAGRGCTDCQDVVVHAYTYCTYNLHVIIAPPLVIAPSLIPFDNTPLAFWLAAPPTRPRYINCHKASMPPAFVHYAGAVPS